MLAERVLTEKPSIEVLASIVSSKYPSISMYDEVDDDYEDLEGYDDLNFEDEDEEEEEETEKLYEESLFEDEDYEPFADYDDDDQEPIEDEEF